MDKKASPQIESAIDQMDRFGDDEDAFKAYMTIVCPFIRLYADEGRFRSLARSQWLSGNKVAIKKLIRSVASGPTLSEQEKDLQKELLKAKATLEGLVEFQISSFLGAIGFRKGDVLTVRGSDGEDRQICFDGSLPELGEAFTDWAQKVMPPEIREQMDKLIPKPSGLIEP